MEIAIPAGGRQGRGVLGRNVLQDRPGQEIGDLAERVQRPQMLGLDRGCIGQPVLDGREDLDSLDRIDAQIGVELHVQFEHLDGVARLVGDHFQKDGATSA